MAWTLLSVICLAVIGLLLADLLGIRPWTARLTIVGLLTLFGPVRDSLTLGQSRPSCCCRCSRPSGCACADPRLAGDRAERRLAVVALCKPQLACLPVAVVLAHGHRRDRQATIVGAAACRDSLLVLGDPAAWSRRDQAILVLVAAISVPDTIGSDTYYMGMGWAVIPLSMSAVLLAAFALARLVPPAWAAATWLVAAALLLPPFEPWFARVKGLAVTLAVLWLLPRLGTGWSRLGVADVRCRPAQAAGRRTNRQGQPIG